MARLDGYASPEYLKNYGMPKKPSDLTKHRVITRTQRQPNNRIDFSTGESILFEPFLYFNDTRALKNAALHGLGIVQLHDYIVANELKENTLVEILSKHTDVKKTIPIHISYCPASQLHIRTRCFLDFMIEVAARLNV